MPTSSYDAEKFKEQKDQKLDLGYYKDEILVLFGQSENTCCPGCNEGGIKESSKCNNGGAAKRDCSDSQDGYSGSSPLFSSGIGEGLSIVHGERLKALLNLSVANLNEQVDDNVETVLAIHRIAKFLKDAKQSSDLLCESDEKMGEPLHQKQNLPFSVISADIRKLAGTIGHSETHGQVVAVSSSVSLDLVAFIRGSGFDSCIKKRSMHLLQLNMLRLDFQDLLRKGGLPAETTLVKYCDDLFVKFTHLEQQLEEYLDTVVSNCREMTLIEKQQLRRRMSNLPKKAMDRVLEIIHHGKLSEGNACDLTYIDLDQEDNVTLWRLYYYVETLTKMKEVQRNR